MNALLKRWIVVASAVFACSTTISLGVWQLSRAQQKTTLHDAMRARAKEPPVDTPQVLKSQYVASLEHRLARLTGLWLDDKTVFLDNRQMRDRVGFYVVTPLQIAPDRAILVYRGWVARNFMDRTILPQLPVQSDVVDVEGRIAPEPGKLYEFQSSAQGAIRQNLDHAALRAELNLDILPVVLMQSGSNTDGLLREWPVINAGVDKHYGYAAQWFALSVLIAGLTLWFQWLQPFFRRNKDSSTHAQ